MKNKRIYMTQYEYVWSLSKAEAIQLATQALKGNGYSLENFKELKLKSRDGMIRMNGRYEIANKCLDWSTEEWENFKKELETSETN